MPEVYVIKEDRRSKKKEVESENRKKGNKFLLNHVLDDFIDIQKNEQDRLLSIIDNKEKKKLLVTYTSFVLFTVLAGMVGGILVFLSKSGLNDITKASLFAALILILIGVNAINLSVIKYIAAFKREIMLSIRQLNCVRQSVATMVFAKLEGKLPNESFCSDKGEKESNELNGLYWPLYGSHIKLPIDNIELRNIYLKNKHNEEEGFAYKALYRSADLFTICAIFTFTLALNAAPVLIILMFHVEDKAINGTFNDGIIFSIVVGVGVLVFAVITYYIMKSFFAIVASPLRKNQT